MITKLKNFASRVWSFARSHKKTSAVVVLALLIVVILLARGGDDALAKKTVKAQVGSVVQEVSVTGRVKAVETADLSFERSGKITGVYTSTGRYVSRGQALVQLDASELVAQRQQAVAGISVAETNIISAQTSLRETVNSSISSVVYAIATLSDLQYSIFGDPNARAEAWAVADAKERALYAFYGKDGLGRTDTWYLLTLKPVAQTELESDPGNTHIEEISANAYKALSLVSQAFDVAMKASGQNASASAADKASISSTASSVRAQLSAIVSAQNALVSAKSQLEQTKTSIASIDAQIAKYTIYSPFYGVVTALDAKRGEMASPGTSAVSVMNTSKFEIEATVPEADIAKLKVGDEASVKLDAYGSDVSFQARVTHIDPAGKVVEGVATYKITLQFTNSDKRILAGLTADMDIHSDQRDNVVFIPTRNIITKDGKKFAQILVQNQNTDTRFANMAVVMENKTEKVIEVPVTTGLRGSDGRTEIISGIREGDVIVAD